MKKSFTFSRVYQLKSLLYIGFILTASAALVVPGGWPPLVTILLASLAALLAIFLCGDILMGRWLRSKTGLSVTPFTFLKECFHSLLAVLGGIFCVLFFFFLFRLELSLVQAELVRNIAFVFLAFSILGFLIGVMRSQARDGKPLAKIEEELSIPPVSKLFSEAVEFNRTLFPRLVKPLLLLLLESIITFALVIVLAGLVVWLGIKYHSSAIAAFDFETWPFLCKFALFVFVGGVGLSMGILLMGAFRIVDQVREFGRLRRRGVIQETGMALETIGFWGTLGWGTFNFIILAILAFSSFELHGMIMGEFKLAFYLSAAVAFTIFLVLVWVLLLFPQIYTLAVMSRRDCGWLRATEISTSMIWLQGFKSFRLAIYCSGLVISIWGIPAAIFLLIRMVDKSELLIAALMKEKNLKEVNQALREDFSARPAILDKYYRSLEKGRYLDALNGFQIYLRTNRLDIGATRGEAIAFLYMGHAKARESLERWVRLDPDCEEAQQRLDELNEGLWGENGALFKEADSRCTQKLGRGI